MLALFPQATVSEEIAGTQTMGAAHYCCYKFGYSNKCLVWYEKKVTLCVLIAPFITCIWIPIFPNPDWFLPEKKEKKEKAFHKHISPYCEFDPLTSNTQKYQKKLHRMNLFGK